DGSMAIMPGGMFGSGTRFTVTTISITPSGVGSSRSARLRDSGTWRCQCRVRLSTICGELHCVNYKISETGIVGGSTKSRPPPDFAVPDGKMKLLVHKYLIRNIHVDSARRPRYPVGGIKAGRPSPL